jgi:REP element-mobilizing transposase RayT
VRFFNGLLGAVRQRKAFRVNPNALLSNHVHLLVEGDNELAVSRGMQALQIRFARGVNRLFERTGPVLADRFHDQELVCPRQARSALAYVLNNARKHGVTIVERMLDPFSSASIFPGWTQAARGETRPVSEQDILSAPTCWLLTTGWRKHGLISPLETPGAG